MCAKDNPYENSAKSIKRLKNGGYLSDDINHTM